MKTFFALALGTLLLRLPTSWGCSGGIAGSHLYKQIANNPEFDDETRAWAKEAYLHMDQIHHLHAAAAGASAGEGINSGDDDINFPEEQNPADLAALEAEEAEIVLAEQQTPAPGAVPPAGAPDPPGRPPTGNPDPPPNRRRLQRSLGGPPGYASLESRASPAPRYIFTDQNRCTKTGQTLVLKEPDGATASDNELNWVYYNVGRARTMYSVKFGRNSIGGGAYNAIGRYCSRLGNAFWDGRQMLFGDGDGRFFNYGSFVRNLDVAGHELTHGVIQDVNPLRYYNQTGALNEHLSDVFGVLAQQWWTGSTAANATWLIGEGLPVGGGALRSMKAPGTAYNNPQGLGKDDQPAHMKNYNPTSDDDYGVHINSGIPNHAFYLASVAIGGQPINYGGYIWYHVMIGTQGKFDYSGETFASFAQKTINSARSIFDQSIADKVHAAWIQVGVLS
jgi:Thermolysin metallopeptidase, alpha-helical domain/Thermolysin metallopeptidase, catalytic domain